MDQQGPNTLCYSKTGHEVVHDTLTSPKHLITHHHTSKILNIAAQETQCWVATSMQTDHCSLHRHAGSSGDTPRSMALIISLLLLQLARALPNPTLGLSNDSKHEHWREHAQQPHEAH